MLKLYSSISLLVHFIGPFVINIVSAFGIIMSALGLIVLAVPRIILTFLLECIQSAREPVIFYLLGYFISYLPPLFLFIVFVLPSTSYKTTFKKINDSFDGILCFALVIMFVFCCKKNLTNRNQTECFRFA